MDDKEVKEVLAKAVVDLQNRILILEFVVGRLAEKLGVEVEKPEGYEEAIKKDILPLLYREKG